MSRRRSRPTANRQAAGTRLARHARLIELFDEDGPGVLGSVHALLNEIEADLPGFRASLREVECLEEVFAITGNGAAALQALRVSAEAGWPCPPRWVSEYLASAVPVLLDPSADLPTVARAFRLREDEAHGGHGAARRVRTLRRQWGAVERVLDVLERLNDLDVDGSSYDALRWRGVSPDGTPFTRVMTAGERAAYSQEVARRQAEARAWLSELPGDLALRRRGEKRVTHAARIVAHELGTVSPATLTDWYYRHTAADKDGYRRLDVLPKTVVRTL